VRRRFCSDDGRAGDDESLTNELPYIVQAYYSRSPSSYMIAVAATNPAVSARQRVRKRDVSFHECVHDPSSRINQIPSLPSLIEAGAVNPPWALRGPLPDLPVLEKMPSSPGMYPCTNEKEESK